MANIIYQYGANVSDVLAKLNQVDKANEKLYKKAEAEASRAIKSIISDHNKLISIAGKLDKSIEQEAKAYEKLAREANKAAQAGQEAGQKIGSGAGISGAQIGIVSGVVSSLTTAFINLGKEAVDVLIRIGEQSVQNAIQFDKTKAQFAAIFKGSKEAADEAFDYVQSQSISLGADLKELAGVFLPKVGSLEQFKEISKLAIAIQRSTPNIIEGGGTRALSEALAGQFTTLNKVANISLADIARIKAAYKESGIDGLIKTTNIVLAENGRSFDATKDTAEAAFNRIGEAAGQLEGKVGEPIVRELQDLAVKGLGFLGTTEDGIFKFNDDIIIFADTIGRTIADVIDYLSSIDFGKLDTKALIEVADYVFRITKALELAATQVGNFLVMFGNFPGVASLIQGLEYELSHLDDALFTLAQIFAVVNASLAGFEANGDKAIDTILALKAAFEIMQGDLLGAADDIAKIADSISTSKDSQDAFKNSLLDSNKQLEDYKKSIEDNKTAQDELRDSLDGVGNASNSAANDILAAADAQRKAASAAEELAAAQKKVDEAEAEATKDRDRKLEDIDIDTARKRADIATDFAQKRVDQAQKSLDAIADLETKYNNDVEAAALDLSRKEEDIARKHGQDTIDLETEQRQAQLDAETNYQRDLADIINTAQIDLDEAAQNRDAVSFLRILKKRDEDITAAGTDRDQELADIETSGEEKRAALEEQQAREIEDAHIANERKLEDLKINLDQQIEAQNVANSREFDQLAIAEQRKNDELTLSRDRQIEDAQLAYDRKLEDLQVSLADEYALIAANNAAIEEEQQRHINEMNAIDSTRSSSDEPDSGGTTRESSKKPALGTAGYSGGSLGTGGANVGSGSSGGATHSGRASGGPVTSGQPVIVGEQGPELLVPSTSGMVLPAGTTQDVLNQFAGSISPIVPGSGHSATEAEQAAGLTAKQNPSSFISAGSGADSQTVQFQAEPSEIVNMKQPEASGGGTVNNSSQVVVQIPPDRLTPGQRAETRQIAIELLDEVSY